MAKQKAGPPQHTMAWELMLEGVGLHVTPDSSITLVAARKGGGL